MERKTYLTKAGYTRLEKEYQHLLDQERPEVVQVVSWAASNGDRSENGDYIYGKKRLREIDKRLSFLKGLLSRATIVMPNQEETERIFFGATVTIDIASHTEKKHMCVTLVGEAEADPAQGKINYLSPLGQTLLKKKHGDKLTLDINGEEQKIIILSVCYTD